MTMNTLKHEPSSNDVERSDQPWANTPAPKFIAQPARPADAASSQASRTSPPPAALPVRGPWSQFRVPRGFEWNRYELPIPALPPQLEGLRIAQITDLHLKRFWSTAYEELIERVRREAPHLIVMTGDFLDSKRNPLPAMPTVRRLVSALRAPLGCVGILGNHDRSALADQFAETGITLIDGRQHVVEVRGASLELLGLPGVDRKYVTPELIAGFPARRFGVPRLVLSHFPDQLRKATSLRPDVFLAGHTHGGQICLPGGGMILRHDSLPRRFCAGVHRVANTWLVVSRGLGFTGIPLRVFCPGEIVEVILTRG